MSRPSHRIVPLLAGLALALSGCSLSFGDGHQGSSDTGESKPSPTGDPDASAPSDGGGAEAADGSDARSDASDDDGSGEGASGSPSEAAEVSTDDLAAEVSSITGEDTSRISCIDPLRGEEGATADCLVDQGENTLTVSFTTESVSDDGIVHYDAEIESN